MYFAVPDAMMSVIAEAAALPGVKMNAVNQNSAAVRIAVLFENAGTGHMRSVKTAARIIFKINNRYSRLHFCFGFVNIYSERA